MPRTGHLPVWRSFAGRWEYHRHTHKTGDRTLNKKTLVTAASLVACSGACLAQQSGVTIYGAVDSYVESARISNIGSFKRVSFNGVSPNRLGFRGSEDLGDGWRAGFVLEHGFAIDTGTTLLGGRMWGRQALVSLGSTKLGEIRLGRQLTPVHFSMFTTDIDSFSATSPMFQVYQSNQDASRNDNQVSYWLPKMGNFSGAVSVTAGEGATVAPGPGTSWVPQAGTVQRNVGALIRYQADGIDASAGIHRGGQQSTAGRATQEVLHAGMKYTFSSYQVAASLWQHSNELPNGKSADNWGGAIGMRYYATPSFYFVGQVGRFQDNGVAYTTGDAKSKGSTTYLNAGADYMLSKRTAIYARAARVDDKDGGFNGRTNASLIGLFGPGTVMPVGGSASTLALGIRHDF
jgi:GBP family porin